MNTLTLIILALILVVVLAMGAAVYFTQQAAKKQRTMSVIKGQGVSGNTSKSEKDNQHKRRAEIARKLKESSEDEKEKKNQGMRAKLRQAGLTISAKQFWLFSFLFGVVVALIVKILGMAPLVVVLSFITGFLGLPRLWLKRKIAKRQKKFLEEFGDALEAIVRLLKAGMPVTEAIAMAAREFEGPVGEEMQQVYDAQKIGVSLTDATLEAAERMPITEMQMFATGIAIQSQTGASLSEVLTNLAGVIRARFKLKRKVLALSAEAKASAMIIGSLPFFVGTALYFMNKEFIMLLFTTVPGQMMTAGGAVWMCIGILVMKMMINFKV